MSIFIFGAGFTSRAFLRHIQNNHDFGTVYGTTRSAEKAGALSALGAKPIVFDGVALNEEAKAALADCERLIISVAPGEKDPVLSVLDDVLKEKMPKLEWINYLSTVGVYGNHDGAWVDEETTCRPVSKRSFERLAAEEAWQKLADTAAVPLSIFRLSGIYGKGRNTFRNFEAGRARRLVKPGQVFNRIMAADIGSAIALAAEKRTAGIFNITDDEPAPPQDVVTFAAEIMGVQPPTEMDFETADLTPMARSFYGENKRVKNEKAKIELGWAPKFPNYRVALEWLWENDWRHE